jgi:hypothetical protein
MTMERDPLLQKLFEIANQDLAGDEFITGVMAQIDALRRRAIIAWAVAGLLLACTAWLLTPTMVGAVSLLSQLLSQTLVEIDDPSAIVSQVMSPLNSVAATVAVTVLVIVFAYRKIF